MNNGVINKKTYEDIFNDLLKLFNKDEVEITKEDNKITFAVDLYDTASIGDDVSSDILNQDHSRYSYIISLCDNNVYEALDKIEDVSSSAGLLKASGYKSIDVGVMKIYKGFFGVIGIDKTTGKKGIIMRDWDINEIKKPVDDYMNSIGYTKTTNMSSQFRELGSSISKSKEAIFVIAFIGIIFLIILIGAIIQLFFI